MRAFLKVFGVALLLVVCFVNSKAFSLLGPNAEWMVPRLGYNLSTPPYGGPMNLGDEYRWNVPEIHYAFTPAFLDYFGQHGVEEVEKAIRILNELPPMNQINVNDYPLSSLRLNHRAQESLLMDLKSYTLTALLHQVGLADPARFVFTLRNRWTTETSTNYYVIKRNFDPDTWHYSSFINGDLWTYSLVTDVSDSESFVFNTPVDPLALQGFRNAAVASGIGWGRLPVGGFWTGLTRDDVAGLHYIYRSSNYNLETAPPDSLRFGFGAVGDSAWGPVLPGVGEDGIPGATTNFVDLAVRPGVNFPRFIRRNFESLFGLYPSNNVTHVDRFITNHAMFQQTLVRSQVIADILFDAADLQGAAEDEAIVTFSTIFQEWQNNSELQDFGDLEYEKLGPGQINPSGDIPAFIFTYNSVGPLIWNRLQTAAGIFALSEFNFVGRNWIWGSFDGSTNPPIVYPQRFSIEDIERQVLEGILGEEDRPALIDPWFPVLPPPIDAVDPGFGDGGGDFFSNP
jgi:hypothetical protein